MANLKEIRTRIASVSSTMQITSAMKMVAAAKLRKAQDAILQLRPYAEKLNGILSAIGDALRDDEDNVFVRERELKKVLLVVFSSNKGMCGAFNSTIIKNTEWLLNVKYGEQYRKNQADLLIIGKKAFDHFKSQPVNIIDSNIELIDQPAYEKVSELAESIIDRFVSGQYDKVELVYNQFINAAVQIFIDEPYLPLKVEEPGKSPVQTTYADYIFEPDKKFIVREIIPKSLKLQLYKALIDSNASEQGARMTAMHKATDNASELLNDLKLDYNKARQANITNEILEIVSGANALEQ